MAALSLGNMVIFGGEHIEPNNRLKNDHKLNDVWTYSFKDNVWNQLTLDNCNVRETLPAVSLISSHHILLRGSWRCLLRDKTCAYWPEA